MDSQWALEVMHKAPYITVSFIDEDGKPYGLPLSLASDDDVNWYFHGALEGKKLEAIKTHPEVCLSRGQDNLSPYYYTWQAPQNLMDQFDGSQSYWDTQEIYDRGTGYDDKLMPLCEKDKANSPESNNTFMLNGAWHEPDYSQSSVL